MAAGHSGIAEGSRAWRPVPLHRTADLRTGTARHFGRWSGTGAARRGRGLEGQASDEETAMTKTMLDGRELSEF